ncbi:hypothetical protein HanRHA438_Chr03g0104931 [Helianthus annuus]|nr:hypothetical protein HanRHA438_Chr03g0104931 [Helianthus annuus]
MSSLVRYNCPSMKHGDDILHRVPVPGMTWERKRVGDGSGTSTKPYPILGTSKTEYR